MDLFFTYVIAIIFYIILAILIGYLFYSLHQINKTLLTIVDLLKKKNDH